jgi:hypothetical protein
MVGFTKVYPELYLVFVRKLVGIIGSCPSCNVMKHRSTSFLNTVSESYLFIHNYVGGID